MAKSKCCNAEVNGKGGNFETRKYHCTKCKKECDVVKTADPPPIPKIQKFENFILESDRDIEILVQTIKFLEFEISSREEVMYGHAGVSISEKEEGYLEALKDILSEIKAPGSVSKRKPEFLGPM